MATSEIEHAKIGDIIYRKDLPSLRFRIRGDKQAYNAWNVEVVIKQRGLSSKGMVFKDDERWVIQI